MMTRGAGERAIDDALVDVYGEVEPHTFEPPDDHALRRVRVLAVAEPRPHWHYVAYGLSELDGKRPDESYEAAGGIARDPEQSGWGLELTFRLAADELDEPPTWPLDLLRFLVGYVDELRNPFAARHTMDLESELDPETPGTALTAIVLVDDPVLGCIDTPNGRVRLLQVVGITQDELDAIREWDPEPILAMLEERHPFGVTDPGRASLLDDEACRRRIEQGAERDGSTQGVAYLSLRWFRNDDASAALINLPAQARSRLRRLLVGRAAHGREFRLYDRTQGVVFEPGEPALEEPVTAVLRVTLDVELARQMATDLASDRDDLAWERLPGLRIRFVDDEELGSPPVS